MLRILVFVGIVVLVFAPFNFVAYRGLTRIHPRRRRWVLAAIVLGNLLWPFLPFLRTFTPFTRFARALVGPLWFGWTSFTILYTALLLLVAIVWLPWRRRVRYADFARRPSGALLAILIIAFPVGYYQALVPLRVEHVPIFIKGLPAEAERTRIVLMGDLHVGLFTRPSRLHQIFSTAQSLRPDLVVIDGDLIDDDPYFVPKLLESTGPLSPSVPLIGVFGNHEMYGDPYAVIEQLRGSRIRLLVNEGMPFRGIWLAAISDYAANQLPGERMLLPDFDKALAGRAPAQVTVAAVHQPKGFDESVKRGIELTLCAHTHGGQFGFRPLRWSLAGVFLEYHMGLYRVRGSQLYVNTGTGYWLFPFRLGMSPEITLIELRRG